MSVAEEYNVNEVWKQKHPRGMEQTVVISSGLRMGPISQVETPTAWREKIKIVYTSWYLKQAPVHVETDIRTHI